MTTNDRSVNSKGIAVINEIIKTASAKGKITVLGVFVYLPVKYILTIQLGIAGSRSITDRFALVVHTTGKYVDLILTYIHVATAAKLTAGINISTDITTVSNAS